MLLVFASRETAIRPVLAVPALARALREVRQSGLEHCFVHIPGGPPSEPAIDKEIERLARGLAVTYCDDMPMQPALIVPGEGLVPSPELSARLRAKSAAGYCEPVPRGRTTADFALPLAVANRSLDDKAKELLAGTGKARDGIISRTLNRPISQAITHIVLRLFGPINPNLATAVTAIISLIMLAALLLIPGQTGLLAGALLFQTASIVDGVDGEIARATFRTSAKGASLDSLVDAATNFLFFIGIIGNLYAAGDAQTAFIVFAGMCGLVLGTIVLGRSAERRRGVVDFETLKQQLPTRNSRVMQWLIWLTMRDFYAFGIALLIAVGLVVPAVMAFSTVVAGWLTVVLVTLVVPVRKAPNMPAYSPE